MQVDFLSRSETVSGQSATSVALMLFSSNYCKKIKWGMFHDIRALLLMIFLATRACVKFNVSVSVWRVTRVHVYYACAYDWRMSEKLVPLSLDRWKSRAHRLIIVKVARRQNDKWRNSPVMFADNRKKKTKETLLIAICSFFFASLVECKWNPQRETCYVSLYGSPPRI